MTDDYYEEKVLAEITEKGLKAGELVGDLPDPNAQSQANAQNAADARAAAVQGGGMGLYRAGGPTTIFGGSGWGPYSDGPLNAVRKSMLTRDGLNEENWMLLAAQKVHESGDEWAKSRREAIGAPHPVPLKQAEGGEAQQPKRQSKRKAQEPLGAYEPHSGLMLCEFLKYPSVLSFADYRHRSR